MPDPFSWLMYIPQIGHHHEWLAVAHAWIVVAFLVLLAVLVARKIKKVDAVSPREDLVPEDGLTLRNAFELYVENILGMMDGMLGAESPRYFWLIGTIFVYIFVSNLMGLVPGFLPPTENINNNLAISLTVFVVYNGIGIKAHGAGYIKHFLGPVAWLAPLMIIVEMISHVVRPVTLAIRLFGNINGDHIVLTIFSQLLPGIFHPILGLGIPIPFIALGIFVSAMQAFVFALLSTIYISMAVAHAH